jgi:hypothetical protein
MKEIHELIGSSPSCLYLYETLKCYTLAFMFLVGSIKNRKFDLGEQPVPIVSTIDESVKE